jgi:hypothetical protein
MGLGRHDEGVRDARIQGYELGVMSARNCEQVGIGGSGGELTY